VESVGLRFNPPPNWPPPPEGFVPQPGWRPDPSWPAPPAGWQLWVDDQQIPGQPGQAQVPPAPQPGPAWQSAGPPPAGPQPGPAWQSAGPPQPDYGPLTLPVYPGGTGMPYASAGPPPSSGKTSGFAITAFVLGLVGVVLLSLIFGILALRRIKRTGERGRGYAIAGLVLSGIWIVLFVILVAVGSMGSATRSSSSGGGITHSGTLSVFSLAVGDCFNNPPGATSLTTVTAIPCTQAHNAQIYAKFDVSGSIVNYPGTSALTRMATSGCNARVGVLDKSKITNSMMIRFLYPLDNSWLDGNRTIACMIANPSSNITSSLLNS
jgi:hypothetical protein